MKLSRNNGTIRHLAWLPRLALLAALVRLITGCSTNSENLSERPWNTPRSWETGLPSGMTEERR